MQFSLSTRLSQQTSLSPQMQQAVRLLLLSSLELDIELEKAAQENPILEFQSSQTRLTGEFDVDRLESLAFESTLIGSLEQQINLLDLDTQTKGLVHYLAGCLDERGYLDSSLENITLELAELFQESYTLEQVHSALTQLQQLEPAGIGAQDLSECLVLQIQRHLENIDSTDPDREPYLLALQICQSHLQRIANNDFSKLRVLLGKSEKQIEVAIQKIKRLNPNPASEFVSTPNQYITPDILVKKRGGLWVAERNPEAIAKISLNQEYINILGEYRDKNAIGAMRQKISEAKWLVKNIQQREESILRVAGEIVARQQNFFNDGDIGMRPLVLREIADNLELHESTVSRVTNQKYLSCPLGLFELKHFFSKAIASEQGDDICATAVQAIIKRIVAQELSSKPISDNSIATILENQGYVIARRTVAKYRESLRIPAMHLRRH